MGLVSTQFDTLARCISQPGHSYRYWALLTVRINYVNTVHHLLHAGIYFINITDITNVDDKLWMYARAWLGKFTRFSRSSVECPKET